MSNQVVKVALPVPLRQSFDYLAERPVPIGSRVKVPFGKQKKIGIVVGYGSHLSPENLRPIEGSLDQTPLLPPRMLELLKWCAEYYQAPIGEQIFAAIPTKLRSGATIEPDTEILWEMTSNCPKDPFEQLKRAPKQAALLQQLLRSNGRLAEKEIPSLSTYRSALKSLQTKEWIHKTVIETDAGSHLSKGDPTLPLKLNSQQSHAFNTIKHQLDRFQCFLLNGVTGSGKTEVYLQLIQETMHQGKSALVLVPEIGLTPQIMERFSRRFQVPIVPYHSAMADKARSQSWISARQSHPAVYIGTRSAVFLPIENLGIIIIDEEHDSSLKQQEGVRYHARDVAIKRAASEKIPVVLGSATPSIESIYNAEKGRYQLLRLTHRVTGMMPPAIELTDLRRQSSTDILSQPLLQALRENLDRGEQSLLFLNRRGFSPVTMCHQCGWIAHCTRCDAKLTFHAQLKQWQCHHCGAMQKALTECPACHTSPLKPLGTGTEKVESLLKTIFPKQAVVRIDRDSTRKRGALSDLLTQAYSGEAKLLVGTQMLAKGHHLPNLSLVGILNTDEGLFSADLRASEHTAQLILQVAGRAGREALKGRVLLQTYHPDHPLLLDLQQNNYDNFIQRTLEERCLAALPPYSALCLLRAEANQIDAVKQFLQEAKNAALTLPTGIELLGPVPAGMERKAGKYRWQLLVQGAQRKSLNLFLRNWMKQLSTLPAARRVRWSVDVDPISLL